MRKRYLVERINRGRYDDWEEIESVLLEYAEKFKKNIKVVYGYRDQCPTLHESGVLFVTVNGSGPSDSKVNIINKTAYGISLSLYQEDAIKSSGKFTDVIDSDGITVAEFTENNIFILFDMAHGENGAKILRLVMEDYFIYADPGNPNSKNDFLDIILERSKEASKNFFEQMYLGDMTPQIEALTSRIENADREVIEYQSRIINKIRLRNELIQKRRIMKDIQKDINMEMVAKRYEAIKKLAKNGSFRVTEDEIIVPLGRIEINYEENTYYIGEFDLIINVKGGDSGVRCINKTKTKASNYHPHVWHTGECCLGNFSDSIAQLIGEMEFEVVVFMMLQFLRSYNPDDKYEDIDSWPIVGLDEVEDD